MTQNKKRELVRQLSLQPEPSTSSPNTLTLQQKRKSLRKQFSEDLPPDRKSLNDPTTIRVTLSSHGNSNKVPSTTAKTSPPPPPIKIAWAENASTNLELEPTAKKEPLNRQPKRFIHTRSSSNLIERDSAILCTRQQLAEKLRQAWRDREKDKLNLNIFLAQNCVRDEEVNVEDSSAGVAGKELEAAPLVESKLEAAPPEDCNFTAEIFQKQMKRPIVDNRHNHHEPPGSNSYQPTRSAGDASRRASTILVVPIIEPKTARPPVITRSTSLDVTNHLTPYSSCPDGNNVLITEPKLEISAAQKRELFQKRTFHSAIKAPPPPLLRASSVPANKLKTTTTTTTTTSSLMASPAQSQNKVVAKRRIKSSGKRKERAVLMDSDEDNGARDGGEDCGTGVRIARKKEVVTMVSLLSPAGSDNEEDDKENEVVVVVVQGKQQQVVSGAEDKEKQRRSSSSAVEEDGGRCFSLRKTVKSVSFQQSSIHAVRSFSASFPTRRSSVVSSLSGQSKQSPPVKLQEKRGSFSEGNESGKPKRRLVRTATICENRSDKQLKEKSTNRNECSSTSKTELNSKLAQKSEEINICVTTEVMDNETVIKSEVNETSPESICKESEATTNKEVNGKETYCWNTYKKLNDNGITISFDTILRGMLTPTEYRIRRKAL